MEPRGTGRGPSVIVFWYGQIRFPDPDQYTINLRLDGRRGERVVDAMLASQQRGAYISPGYKRRRQTLETRVAYWLKELGLISDFQVEPIREGNNIYQVRVQRTHSSAQVLITDVGFGVSQILPVIVLCYYVPEGSIILLEQPEIHLHPSVQSGLADVLIDAIKNRNVQIVVESHSEHLLRRLQRRVAEEVITPEQTALPQIQDVVVTSGTKTYPNPLRVLR